MRTVTTLLLLAALSTSWAQTAPESLAITSTIETSATVADTNQQLKILSWNIFMLPKIVRRTGQNERALLIAQKLKESDYDLIVFQEAFDETARTILWNEIKSAFPYQQDVLNMNSSGFTITNGGVWIISKYPTVLKREIKFKERKGVDMFARKGALLVEVTKEGHKYQVVGTHLQAEDSERLAEIRGVQYQQIIDELLKPYRDDNIPQIICGDFNVSRKDLKQYNKMIESFSPDSIWNCNGNIGENCPVVGTDVFTWNGQENDLVTDGEQTTYDYILVRKNNFNFKGIKRNVKNFVSSWSSRKWKNKKNLSDHYAVEIVLVPGSL
jgi:sphingomyelin phosphodiesterase